MASDHSCTLCGDPIGGPAWRDWCDQCLERRKDSVNPAIDIEEGHDVE